MKRFVVAALTLLMVMLTAVSCGGQSSATADEDTAPSAPAVQKATSTSAPEAPPANTPVPPDTPTPQPTATSTPTSVPTATPTPGPADYDHDRFARALTVDPPDLIQATLSEQLGGGAVQTVELAVRWNTGEVWMKVSLSGADSATSMEIMVIGDRTYLRGETAEEIIDWISAPTGEGLNSQALTGDLTPSAALAEAPLAAVAVEPCGSGQLCFVLANADDSTRLLLVDTETYLPAAIRNLPAEGESAGSQVDLIWGGEFDFNPPADAVEVPEDELAVSLFVLLLAMTPAEGTATDVPADSDTAGDRGTRAEPLPVGSTIASNDFSIEIVEILRGEPALDNLLAANDFNDPPAEGKEYVQLHILSTYEGTDPDAESATWDFRLTGSSGVSFDRAQVFQAEPGLDVALGTGETADGWVAFEVPADETDLMVIYRPFRTYESDPTAYLALEPGAGILPDRESFPQPTDRGLTRADPAPIGEPVVNPDWELTVLEVRRDRDLFADLEAESPWIDPPTDGYEYLAVMLRARYLGPADQTTLINKFRFGPTGSENVLYEAPFTASFAPGFSYELFPGAVVEGWATYEVLTTDTNLTLRFGGPFGAAPEHDRFLALDPGASVPPPAGRLAEAHEAGTDSTDPVGVGDTTVGPTWQIELVEVVRGPDALEAVTGANDFNDPPPDGMEYLLLLVDVRNVGDADEPAGITEFSFELFGSTGAQYEMPFITIPSPGIDIDLFPGGRHRGWIAFQVLTGVGGLLLKVDPTYFQFTADHAMATRYFAIP